MQLVFAECYTSSFQCQNSKQFNNFLLQPILCENTIEHWLPHLADKLQLSLQQQMATALGYKKISRPRHSRTIHSAGARRVELSGNSLAFHQKCFIKLREY